MFSRIETEAEPTFLPDEWCGEVSKLLNSLYSEALVKNDRMLEVYGLTFPTEVVLMVSILSSEDETLGPITYMASADLEGQADPKALLDILVDSTGGFLDHIFSDLAAIEFLAIWSEAKIKNKPFYYMITRENVGLSLEATKLLRNH